MLYAFFWVILYADVSEHSVYSTFVVLCRWTEQSVSKRRHIKFKGRGITRKKAYNFLNICLNLLHYIAIKTLLKIAKNVCKHLFEPGRSHISGFLFPDFYYHF